MPKGYTKRLQTPFRKQINVVFRNHLSRAAEAFPQASLLSFEMYFTTCINSDMGLPVLPSLAGVSARIRLITWVI